MKTLTPQLTANDFFKAILPAYGTQLDKAFKRARWIAGQKFWLVKDYLKQENGNYYYIGVRFVDNLMIVEKDAMWNSWTYLDDLEIWAFDGKTPRLIQKKKYEKHHRDEDDIRKELTLMLTDFVKSQAKLNKVFLGDEEIRQVAEDCINRSFKDFLDDDYEIRLTQMIPLLEKY